MKEDFEEWLARQDIPVEDTVTWEDYQEYLREEIGLQPGSIAATEDYYRTRYDIMPQLGIHPFPRHYEVRGEPFVETRYGIAGYPGSWGTERMYDIAIEKATALAQTEWVGWLEAKRRTE